MMGDVERDEAWDAFQAALEEAEDRIAELPCGTTAACVDLIEGWTLHWEHHKKVWGLYVYGNATTHVPLNSAPIEVRLVGVTKLPELVALMRETHTVQLSEIVKATNILKDFLKEVE